MGPAGIELATPESAVRLASVARHVTDCATRPSAIQMMMMMIIFFMSHTYDDDDIQHFFTSHTFDKICYISLKLLTG